MFKRKKKKARVEGGVETVVVVVGGLGAAARDMRWARKSVKQSWNGKGQRQGENKALKWGKGAQVWEINISKGAFV